MVTWIEALREHSKKTGKFAVPRKGTADYEAIMKLMAKGKAPEPKKVEKAPEPVVVKPARARPTKKEMVESMREETANTKRVAKIIEAEAEAKKLPPPPPKVLKEADKPVLTRDQLLASLTEKQKERLAIKAQKKAEKARLRAEKKAEKNLKVSIVHQPVELEFT